MTPTNDLPRPSDDDADWDAIENAARRAHRYATSRCRAQIMSRSDSYAFHLVHAAIDWVQAELSRSEEVKPAKCVCSLHAAIELARGEEWKLKC